MAERPLLFLPRPGAPLPRITKKIVVRESFKLPSRDELSRRFSKTFESAIEAFIAQEADNVSPENILVLETVGRIEDFRSAVSRIPGLTWQGEIDIDGIESDDNYYSRPKIGTDFFKDSVFGFDRNDSKIVKNAFAEAGLLDEHDYLLEEVDIERVISTIPEEYEQHQDEIIEAIEKAKGKGLPGRLYLSLSNRAALTQVKIIFDAWKRGEDPPQLSAPWKNLFSHLYEIRFWDVEDRLRDTGIIDYWQKEVELKRGTASAIVFEAELSYSNSHAERRDREKRIAALIAAEKGTLRKSCQIQEIGFHALKLELPVAGVERVLRGEYGPLFKNGSILFFRPVSQSINIRYQPGETENLEAPEEPQEAPVAALLDGLPFSNHELLRNCLTIEDPDNFGERYNPNEYHHGTAMASLICHGEIGSGAQNIASKLYVRPILQPSDGPFRNESIPKDVFFEDIVERSVRRMKEGENGEPPTAPSVKIINLSVADPDRAFHHYPSSIARLLDWLSYKYDILFCVSAGNYLDDIQLGVDKASFLSLEQDEKTALVFAAINRNKRNRRIFAPSESINSITVGALHSDQSPKGAPLGNRIDILGSIDIPSPVSTLGCGFRSSVKPDILMPGGRQLYDYINEGLYSISDAPQAPGQKVASAPVHPGETGRTLYSRGTSNATAIATRSAVLIHETLVDLFNDAGEPFPVTGYAPLLKTLLVHGACWGSACDLITRSLGLTGRQKKKEISRFLGFGIPDIQKVMECTENRATAIGYGSIKVNQRHEYRFPLPPSMSGTNLWRKLTITMAWNSPVNSDNRKYRRAALSYEPKALADQVGAPRREADHDQVRNGTIQHEIFEGEDVKAYVENESLVVAVQCREDAGSLDMAVSYGLAVSLEVKEGVGIPVYDEVRNAIEIAIQERVVGRV